MSLDVHTVVGSLILRMNYGGKTNVRLMTNISGMKGDQAMLSKFALAWFHRLSDDSSTWRDHISKWYTASETSTSSYFRPFCFVELHHLPPSQAFLRCSEPFQVGKQHITQK